MQKILFFILLPILAFSQPSWEDFQVDSLNFTVKTPFPLDHKVNEAMTDFGLQKIISFGVRAPETHDNYLYQIMVIPYPDSTFHQDSTAFKNMVIQEFVNASHDNEIAEKIYQTSTSKRGQSFEQWVIHHGKEFSIKSRATINDNSLYVIQVITPFDKSVNTKIDKFLNSFTFLDSTSF